MFGSSGHLRPLGPNDRVAQSYTKCTESSYIVNSHVKSIVQPKLTERADNPHSFTYADGYFAVAPDFSRVRRAAQSHPIAECMCTYPPVLLLLPEQLMLPHAARQPAPTDSA